MAVLSGRSLQTFDVELVVESRRETSTCGGAKQSERQETEDAAMAHRCCGCGVDESGD